MESYRPDKLNIILTGATGMVGEGVLHECLQSDQVETILVLNRKPCHVTHPKLTEYILNDFFDLSSIEPQLKGYNTCFFCLGISSIGMKEDQYRHITYDLTMNVAQVLLRNNPGMTFCYISGAGTDSTENGKLMWARIKGKTENDLKRLPFKKVYNFRPGMLIPTKGLKNTHQLYKYLGWMIPFMKAITPKYISTLKELGLAMINAASKGYTKNTIEVTDIKLLAGKG